MRRFCLATVKRCLYSGTRVYPPQLQRDVCEKIQAKWLPVASEIDNVSSNISKKKAYILAMFPYPSGNLHMGHVRVYTISDIMARYYAMQGYSVMHPMGWDAFGLPAENAAKERGIDPHKWTTYNIEIMRGQLSNLCLMIDWSKAFSTTDSSYFKWTQWLFIKLFEEGLAYQRSAKVFWDPIDQTVLAAEQVDENGRSWRSGAVIEHKYLKQWFFRTTAYAKPLKDNLDNLNRSFWKEVIDLQRNWLGTCDGCRVDFKIVRKSKVTQEIITVFTRTPELLFGVTHIVLSSNHHYAQEANDLLAENPVNNTRVPFVIDPGTELEPDVDCRLGIPSEESEFDNVIVSELCSQWPKVLSADESIVINSGFLTGLSRKEAFETICEFLRNANLGGHITSAKLDDWLISRQRSWGTPIPIIHCPGCGPQAVPEKDLPVLPCQINEPCSCPTCGNSLAKRESDTLDTFVDSSWYFLRFADPHNNEKIFDSSVVNQWLPVDLYVGGREHAIMHLYFARFICYFLHDLGIIDFKEPFTKLLTQGMIYGKSFKDKKTGKYLKSDEVEMNNDKKIISKLTHNEVSTSWEKMSKSKHNGVDPQDVLNKYGVDAVRTCVVANVAPKSTRKWSEDQFTGVINWHRKMWTMLGQFLMNGATKHEIDADDLLEQERIIRESRNYFVKEINFHMEVTYLLNTAIARLQGLTTSLRKVPAKCHGHSMEFVKSLSDLIVMIYPFSPCLALEMWESLCMFAQENNIKLGGRDGNIPLKNQPWPKIDSDYSMSLVVKIDSVQVGAIPLTFKELNEITPEKARDLVIESNLANDPNMLKSAGFEVELPKLEFSTLNLIMAMNTFLARLNNLFAFFLTTLAVVIFAAFLTTFWLSNETPVDISVVNYAVSNGPDFTGDRKKCDLGQLSFSIKVDFSKVFNWNVKQLFVILYAQYKTPKNAVNQVTLWDRILLRSQSPVIQIAEGNSEYYFFDDGMGLKGNNVSLVLAWNVVPNAGYLALTPGAGHHVFTFPNQYTQRRL